MCEALLENCEDSYIIHSYVETSERVLEHKIKLTDNAIDDYTVAEKNKTYVRLSIKGGGCAGLNTSGFDNEQQRGDMLLKDILLVHRDFELYLLGTTLDWVEDTFKVEFVIVILIVNSCSVGIV